LQIGNWRTMHPRTFVDVVETLIARRLTWPENFYRTEIRFSVRRC
jgi:hypothetical protein